MLFNSWTFFLFFCLVFAVYHVIPAFFKRCGGVQLFVLVAASLFFYGYQNWGLLILLTTSILLNGLASQFILSDTHSQRAKWRVCITAVSANLAGIAFFKYAALISELFLPGTRFAHLGPWLREIPLPLGISFYTFEGISLVVDVWRNRDPGCKHLHTIAKRSIGSYLSRVSLFVTFFPHLVAGPIVRGPEFIEQIGPKYFRQIDWNDGIKKLILGFFLKMVVADNLREATAALSWPNFTKLASFDLLFLLYGFSFQIFADFCGYSLIALGLARLFGYVLPLNFNFPYISRSITEFWQRWHITLSLWLRDYLYIPLGGNRKGVSRTYFNLFIVMFLGGLWHGAAWNFAIWGIAHGIFLAAERFIAGRRRKKTSAVFRYIDVLSIVWTFHVVSFLWLLFKLSNFSEIQQYLLLLFTGARTIHPVTFFVIALFSMPVILYHLWSGLPLLREKITVFLGASRFKMVEDGLFAILTFLIITNSGTPGAFIYFQF